MWLDNRIFSEDMEYIAKAEFIPWEHLRGKTFFITGSTGLIGYYLTNALIYKNIKEGYRIKLLALVRDIDKAKELYKQQLCQNGCSLHFLVGSIEEIPNIDDQIDYIIHAAAPTSSGYFLEKPVETMNSLLCGTKTILALAKEKKIHSMVYLSSMEIYGAIHNREKLDEAHGSNLNTMSARSSYPEGKRACETLCASYVKEYKVPVKVLRLVQTFGPGIQGDDQRVFAQFVRDWQQQKDIVLLTDGQSSRSYLYLTDAVSAILAVLLNGRDGEVYNVANEDTYCSIRELAEVFVNEIAHNEIKVVVRFGCGQDVEKFPPPHFIDLDTAKLKTLSWRAHVGLREMILRTVSAMEYERNRDHEVQVSN